MLPQRAEGDRGKASKTDRQEPGASISVGSRVVHCMRVVAWVALQINVLSRTPLRCLFEDTPETGGTRCRRQVRVLLGRVLNKNTLNRAQSFE